MTVTFNQTRVINKDGTVDLRVNATHGMRVLGYLHEDVKDSVLRLFDLDEVWVHGRVIPSYFPVPLSFSCAVLTCGGTQVGECTCEFFIVFQDGHEDDALEVVEDVASELMSVTGVDPGPRIFRAYN